MSKLSSRNIGLTQIYYTVNTVQQAIVSQNASNRPEQFYAHQWPTPIRMWRLAAGISGSMPMDILYTNRSLNCGTINVSLYVTSKESKCHKF